MEIYPSYRLEDFYRKSFLEGGLTFVQMLSLYKLSQEREYQRMKFTAIIHGAKFDESKEPISSPGKSISAIPKNPMTFGDPASYAKLSEKEKQDLTKKMMGIHKAAMKSTPLGG